LEHKARGLPGLTDADILEIHTRTDEEWALLCVLCGRKRPLQECSRHQCGISFCRKCASKHDKSECSACELDDELQGQIDADDERVRLVLERAEAEVATGIEV